MVIGTSGLTAADYLDIERTAKERKLGVIAAGNFSLTAALAKHFALIAAKHLPSWEIIDYAKAEKVDAPSGTVRELADALGEVAQSKVAIPVEQTHGEKETRGATIGGTQVHSIRLAWLRHRLRDDLRPAPRAPDDPARCWSEFGTLRPRNAAGCSPGNAGRGAGARAGPAAFRASTDLAGDLSDGHDSPLSS